MSNESSRFGKCLEIPDVSASSIVESSDAPRAVGGVARSVRVSSWHEAA